MGCDDLREKLADVQHEIWSHWMKWQFSCCQQNSDGSLTIPAVKVERWQRQMNTSYNDLSFAEQESDREQADKVLNVLESEPIAVTQLAGEVSGGMGKLSDGYHTFDELYEHRCLLFAAFLKNNCSSAWRSPRHHDGTQFRGWFIAGAFLGNEAGEYKQISYHMPDRMWSLLDGIFTLERSPKWDGHTSQDVCDRLKAWIEGIHIHHAFPDDALIAASDGQLSDYAIAQELEGIIEEMEDEA